jgi:hypothetical protein
MASWPTELVRLGIEAAARSKTTKTRLADFDPLLRKLHEAFDAQPYGDPKKIADAADKMKSWADDLAKDLNGQTIDAETARALLGEYATLYRGTVGKPRLLDYDSARQVAWSFELMYKELAGNEGDPKLFEKVDTYLKLRLPRGRRKIIEDELKESLEKRNAYNPETFRKLLTDLAGALGKSKR